MYNKFIKFWDENTMLFLLLLPFELLAASLVLTLAMPGNSPPEAGACAVVFGVFVVAGTLLATLLLLLSTAITSQLNP